MTDTSRDSWRTPRDIKSYYLRCNPINGRFYMAEIGVDGSGGDCLRYVLHTDHAEAMAGKDAEIERLRGALEEIQSRLIDNILTQVKES